LRRSKDVYKIRDAEPSRRGPARIPQHPQLHLYEDEEFDAGKKDPEADDPNEWLLGPERQLSSKAKA